MTRGLRRTAAPRTDLPVLELDCVDLAVGGDGIARHDGKVVFVPHLIPGARANVQIVEDKGSFARGRILAVMQEGRDHVRAACPVHMSCGGCLWMHLAPQAAGETRRTQCVQLLSRALGAEVRVQWKTPATAGRHRARFQVVDRRPGYFAPRSHDFVAVDDCAALTVGGQRTLRALVPALRDVPCSLEALSLTMDGDDRGAVLGLHLPARHTPGEDRGRDELRAWLPGRAESLGLRGAWWAVGDGPSRGSWGETHVTIRVPDAGGDLRPLRAREGVFTQVDLGGNLELVRTVLELAAPRPGEKILDLYCGMGNFSLPLASAGASVTGLESGHRAVEDGSANAAAWGLASRAAFLSCDLKQFLMEHGREAWNTVVLDPPRAGAKEIAPLLAEAAPEKIVYVSCEPTTLARDLKPLHAAGYRITEAVALDLFPHTPHWETVVRLDHPAARPGRG